MNDMRGDMAMELSEREEKILHLIRSMGDGQMRITVEDHVPSRVDIHRDMSFDEAPCETE